MKCLFICLGFFYLLAVPVDSSQLSTQFDTDEGLSYRLRIDTDHILARLDISRRDRLYLDSIGFHWGDGTSFSFVMGPLGGSVWPYRPLIPSLSVLRSESGRLHTLRGLSFARDQAGIDMYTGTTFSFRDISFIAGAAFRPEDPDRQSAHFSLRHTSGLTVMLTAERKAATLPSLDAAPYIMSSPIPASGTGGSFQGILHFAGDSLNSTAGTFVSYAAMVPLQIGVWAYVDYRRNNSQIAASVGHDPGGYRSYSSLFRLPARPLHLLAEHSGEQHMQSLSLSVQLEEGFFWTAKIAQKSRLVFEDLWMGLHAGFDSSGNSSIDVSLDFSQRIKKNVFSLSMETEIQPVDLQTIHSLKMDFSSDAFSLDYTAGNDSRIPGIEQKIGVAYRQNTASLQAELLWNSLQHGLRCKIGFRIGVSTRKEKTTLDATLISPTAQ